MAVAVALLRLVMPRFVRCEDADLRMPAVGATGAAAGLRAAVWLFELRRRGVGGGHGLIQGAWLFRGRHLETAHGEIWLFHCSEKNNGDWSDSVLLVIYQIYINKVLNLIDTIYTSHSFSRIPENILSVIFFYHLLFLLLLASTTKILLKIPTITVCSLNLSSFFFF